MEGADSGARVVVVVAFERETGVKRDHSTNRHSARGVSRSRPPAAVVCVRSFARDASRRGRVLSRGEVDCGGSSRLGARPADDGRRRRSRRPADGSFGRVVHDPAPPCGDEQEEQVWRAASPAAAHTHIFPSIHHTPVAARPRRADSRTSRSAAGRHPSTRRRPPPTGSSVGRGGRARRPPRPPRRAAAAAQPRRPRAVVLEPREPSSCGTMWWRGGVEKMVTLTSRPSL